MDKKALHLVDPISKSLNAPVPLDSYFTVTGLSLALIIGIYFCGRKISFAKGIVAFFHGFLLVFYRGALFGN